MDFYTKYADMNYVNQDTKATHTHRRLSILQLQGDHCETAEQYERVSHIMQLS